jgi:DnaJ-class molecular chaperone
MITLLVLLFLFIFYVECKTKNFYEILGVKSDATQKEIKKSFHQLSRKYHPDHAPAGKKEQHHKIMRDITEAYATVSDSEKRKQYDLSLSDPFRGSNFGNRGGQSYQGPPTTHSYSFHFSDIRNLFSSYFAGKGGSDSAQRKSPGFDFNFGGGFRDFSQTTTSQTRGNSKAQQTNPKTTTQPKTKTTQTRTNSNSQQAKSKTTSQSKSQTNANSKQEKTKPQSKQQTKPQATKPQAKTHAKTKTTAY